MSACYHPPILLLTPLRPYQHAGTTIAHFRGSICSNRICFFFGELAVVPNPAEPPGFRPSVLVIYSFSSPRRHSFLIPLQLTTSSLSLGDSGTVRLLPHQFSPSAFSSVPSLRSFKLLNFLISSSLSSTSSLPSVSCPLFSLFFHHLHFLYSLNFLLVLPSSRSQSLPTAPENRHCQSQQGR